jgi:sulfoxide reductase heme-binding subunit YedZ
MKDIKFVKIVIIVNGLVPLVLLLWDAWWGKLGANPTEFALRTTGILTLIFLFITLAITPARKILKINELVKTRRMLGLFAFFYVFLHFTTYLWFDREWNLSGIAADIWQRPFIAIGMAAFFMMIPLAVTSTNAMIKRLGGKRWQLLHRLTYVVAVCGVVHYYMIQKSDVTEPLIFAGILGFLLGYRIYINNQKAVQTSESSVMPK